MEAHVPSSFGILPFKIHSKIILVWLITVTAFALVFRPQTVRAQESEFTIYESGLIYDARTMQRLGFIVDSLNLKFKSCEPRQYIAIAQGTARNFSVNHDLSKAKDLIKENVAPQAFEKILPTAFDSKQYYITKTYETDYKDNRVIEFSELPMRKGHPKVLRLPRASRNDRLKGWVYSIDGSKLSGFYLNLDEQPLSPEYGRLVQYVDCMIDTSAQIYLNKESYGYQPRSTSGKASEFIAWANKFPGAPKKPEDADGPFAETQWNKYLREMEQWNNKRLDALDQKIEKAHYYKSLLADAADEALENNYADAELEFYVERYLSAEKALELKRHRKPVGMCSMDRSPRIHAASICRLAAATAKWDIFLRAHLDIMNDRFARMSDGSYAWGERGTYLKELEELHIQAVDLLIGTCLGVSNVNDNHYFGNIGRIGRALSDAKDKGVVEEKILGMITDNSLDLYNRLLMAYLFDNYNYYLDEDRKKVNNEKFQVAIKSLPKELSEQFSEK